MAIDIRIGTASWTDPGFVEDWYPVKLPASRRLNWYAAHFNYVEVNATFYSIPAMRVVERWCYETPDDFVFDIKLTKLLSWHVMPAKFLPPDLRSRITVNGANVELTPKSQELVAKRLLRELQPLFHAKKFGVFLLQLSPSFRPKNHDLKELDSVRELLSPHRMAIELRNRDWVTEPQLSETVDYFRSRRLTFVLVDAPQSEHFTVMPGLDCVTNPQLGYLRFHGRNEEGYVKGRTVAERFDHDYSDAEVSEVTDRIVKIEEQVKELHIVANNNRSNYAPRLAERIQKLLREQGRLKDFLQGQGKEKALTRRGEDQGLLELEK
jgi:uncharacterized protein YecE (DUF72 family)